MKVKQETVKSGYRQEVGRFFEKIMVNTGTGRLSQQPNFSAEGGSASGGEGKKGILAQIMRDLSLITGQAPQICRAKKSIAGFKLREGQIVGLSVTLRRTKMVDFFERLIKIVLPRVRDFNGLSRSAIDKGGVLNIGLKEQFVFPELSPEHSPVVFSLGISLVPRLKNRQAAIDMLLRLGVPLKRLKQQQKTKN